MLQVKFKKLYDDVKLPVKGSLHAACFDVYVHSVEIDYGTVTYRLGFATEIPHNYKGVIVPRSNLTKHKWVMNNNIGVIDADYRGEWMVKLRSIGSPYEALPYGKGDRIAQIYFEKVEEVEFVEVDELDASERGEGGFGSTGVGDFVSTTYVKPEFATFTNTMKK